MNPFKKHDVSDFEDVYVPLADAQRHPSVVTAHHEKLGAIDGRTSDHARAEKDGELGIQVGSTYGATTIEGLRAEIDSDIAASGHDTAYDRMWTVFSLMRQTSSTPWWKTNLMEND